ncbi:MAG: hypothetical protein AAGA99_13190 [Actinomycetota bacterium]
MIEPSSGRIAEPFVQALAERDDLPEVQIIGGNGSTALLDERTVIDLDRRTIVAPVDCDLPQHRPDGTLRDLDALVLSTDPVARDRVEALAEETIGDRLANSVFGLKPLAELDWQRAHPAWSTARVFLGDRYVDTSEDPSGRIVDARGFKALYPFRAPIGTSSLETFQLHRGDRPAIPTAHPGATILNYLTRSISGLRSKDRAKVEAMADRVLARNPAVGEWINDGPGRDQLDLAGLLLTLRRRRTDAPVARIGHHLEVVLRDPRELEKHPGFMADHLGPNGRRAVIQLARAKSRVVGGFESHQTVITFWQHHIERRLRGVVHNEPVHRRPRSPS